MPPATRRLARTRGPGLVHSILVACLLALPVAAGDGPPGGARSDDLLVVRWATDDLDAVARQAERFDLWTYLPAERTAVFGMSPEQLATATAEGLVLEIDEERTREVRLAVDRVRLGRGDGRSIPGYPCYRTVEETYADLEQLAADHPDLAVWGSIGGSWERVGGPSVFADGFESGDLCAWLGGCSGTAGYEIGTLVLGNQTSEWPKAPFVLVAAMHAREYATAEIATRFAEALVEGYGNDPRATWILDHTEIHVVPHLNPDGRKRAEADVLWRKNTNDEFCGTPGSIGIDLNRNSSFEWGGTGSSGSACFETFRGPSPASEPETRAIEDWLALVFPDQRGPALGDAAGLDATGVFISLHSYAPTILYPWEFDVWSPAPDEEGLRTFGLKLGHRTGYGASQNGLPSAAGTIVDVAYGEYGVAAYTFEAGTSFFQSCESFESTVAPDNLEGLFYAASAARRPYRAGRGPDVRDVVLGSLEARGAISPGQGGTVEVTAVADATLYGEPEGNSTAAPASPSVLSAVRVSIDAPPWAGPVTTLSADDGVFDETVEAVSGQVSLSGLAPGRHLVYVIAEDVDGDVGPPTVVFLDVPSP